MDNNHTKKPLEPKREEGILLHRRETRLQIYLPFILGLLGLLGMVLLVAVPSNPIWRIRAEAIADWMITILCLAPLVTCIFPLFMVVMLGIWGMNRVQASTERPLRKLEKMASDLAARVNKVNDYIIEKTTQVSTSVEPVMDKICTFDTPEPLEEEVTNATTE